MKTKKIMWYLLYLLMILFNRWKCYFIRRFPMCSLMIMISLSKSWLLMFIFGFKHRYAHRRNIRYIHHTEAEWLIYVSENKSTLIQITVCCILGANPLSELVLAYYWLNLWEQISVKFESNWNNFHAKILNLKRMSATWRPFVAASMC